MSERPPSGDTTGLPAPAGMKELLRDRLVVAGEREDIWAVIEDPEALARVLPGCEALARLPDGRLGGVLAARLGFLTVRADVTAALGDADPPRAARLDIEGRPRLLAGSFRAVIPFELEPRGEGRTEVSYRVDLAVSGRLATFGLPFLRDTMRRQVTSLAAGLERELAARAGVAPSAPRSPVDPGIP
jgi:2-furoyl-CoA dehydrogenase large subunit